MDDQEIIALFQERSENAIFAASAKYGAYLRAIAGRLLPSGEDAEECVNDAYLKAWQSIPPHRPQRLAAFLGKITRNLALDRLREQGRVKRGQGELPLALSELEDLAAAASGPEEELEESETLEAIDRFLREQTREKRVIFVQRYWYLRPIREIAEENGMTAGKVKTVLFRMRNELKRQLGREGIKYEERKTV